MSKAERSRLESQYKAKTAGYEGVMLGSLLYGTLCTLFAAARSETFISDFKAFFGVIWSFIRLCADKVFQVAKWAAQVGDMIPQPTVSAIVHWLIQIILVVGVAVGVGFLLFIGGEKLYSGYKEHFADQISLAELLISFAVVVFTLYPIALVLFKEGNVSKRLFPAALFAGCASFTMVGLPGSPQIQNIMPTEVLGTTAYAAPLNGIVVSCIIFALSMVWLEWNDKRLKAAGIGFVPGRKDDLEAIDISDRTGMLPFGLAVIPILFVVLYIFVMQQVLKDAVTWSTNYIVIQSLALGCLLAFALFHKRIHAFRDSVNDAATNSLIALMNTAVVTGFGGVVQ